MQKNTKKLGAVVCAGVILALSAAYLAVILFSLLAELRGNGFAAAFLVVYCALLLAIIAGVLLALRQRLKEIKGGEEEDASKY